MPPRILQTERDIYLPMLVTPLGDDRLMTTPPYQRRCDKPPARMFVDGHLIVAEWYCPVCDAPAHRTHQAGRPRVYCTNACRQRAYRWRRDNHRSEERRVGKSVGHGGRRIVKK